MSHPYVAALADGFSHVLTLSTRPHGLGRSTLALHQKVLIRHLDRLRQGLGERYRAVVLEYFSGREWLSRKSLATSRSPGDPPFVFNIAPPEGAPPVGRLERDRAKIIDGGRSGYEAVVESITGRSIRAYPKFTFLETV